MASSMDLAYENSYPTPYANTSFLPMILMSLLSQKHSPKTKNKFKSEYDYIVVGAGSAGSVVASRLSEIPCVNVLLLEAGKAPPRLTDVPILANSYWGTDINWIYRTTKQKNSARAMVNNRVTLLAGKNLGGSSISNAMTYTRGNKEDYNNWAKNGAYGWSYSDVQPYFYKLEDNTDPRFIADGFHVIGGPLTVSEQKYKGDIVLPLLEAAKELGIRINDPNSRNATGFYDGQVNVRNGQRCSSAKAYLVPAENRTNLDIVANALVTKVIIKKNKAVGVLFQFEKKTYVVRAKREVIVSAGSFNTAKILMLSGIGPKKQLNKLQIPVIANLPVGSGYEDHYGTALYFELDPRIPSIRKKVLNATNVDLYVKKKEGVLTVPGVNPLAFLPINENNKTDIPDFELLFGEGTTPTPNKEEGIRPELIKKYFGPYANSTIYVCITLILRPKSRGTVRLRSDDPQDPPIIDPNYFGDPEDVKPIVAGLKACERIGKSKAMRNIGAKQLPKTFPGCEKYTDDDDKYYECLAKSYFIPIYHAVGTAKMGDSKDPKTVVDSSLRVRGISSLRVVDCSVMPTIPSGNTNVPAIMIGEKASDLIKATIDHCN